MAVGKEITSQVKVSNNAQATYSVVPKDVKIATASVDSNGKITVTGVAAGNTTIVVNVTTGSETKALDLAVKVTAQMAITLDKTAVTTYPNAETTINATISGSGTITAVSSDTNLATVSVKDKAITIKGVKAGSVTVTVIYTERQ